MKRIALIASIVVQSTLLFSQSSAQISPNNQLVFSLNNGEYEFGLGGLIQASANRLSSSISDPKNQLFPQRTFFNFQGKSYKNGLGFFVQTDFSMPSLLLDAVMTYQPTPNLNLEIGQRQNVGNNRELLLQEGNLMNPDRELLSSAFARSGREFGIFIDHSFALGKWVLNPQISVTSGDGMNSFGIDSRDVDQGGLKYSGRLDIYPFGNKLHYRQMQLSTINSASSESSTNSRPWAVFGIYGSINQGASDSKGEGHNNFSLYTSSGETLLPNFRKWGVDLLFKWNRLSLLAEYTINTANGIQGSYTDIYGTQKLKETQISEYLTLGSGYQMRLGYLLPKQFELYGTYGTVNQEFNQNPYSLLQSQSSWKTGLSKYNKTKNLRLHFAFGRTTLTKQQTSNTQIHFGAQMTL
ncbi:MAG: hypothetical protein O2814_00010 [Bacteroidetes bacterium]|nr:hypothetical protein [Bacteroidota bacterium]MDA1224813.1 hypothetical protein [Bacteroidota bacterium]